MIKSFKVAYTYEHAGRFRQGVEKVSARDELEAEAKFMAGKSDCWLVESVWSK